MSTNRLVKAASSRANAAKAREKSQGRPPLCLNCGTPEREHFTLAGVSLLCPDYPSMYPNHTRFERRPRPTPKCEECNTELHEFVGPNGESGLSCDTCGWSWDATMRRPPKPRAARKG